MKCDHCGAPVENGTCTQCGKAFPAASKNMTVCKVCGTPIAKSAKRCPGCGGKIKKPIYIKWWFWVLIAVILIAAVSGGGSSSKKKITSVEGDDTTYDPDSGKITTASTDTESEPAESEASPKNADTTIESQVLFDHDGIVITAEEYIADTIFGDKISVLIENNSDKSVGIGCDALIVNDYMISDLFSATVAAGKKSRESIDLWSTQLEAAGIENVGQIEIAFRLFDPENYMTEYSADLVTIKTSDYDAMDTTPNDEGTELYNKDGVRIVGKYVDEDSFWGAAVLLYMENNSGKEVTVSCDDLSVNGFMVTSFLYANIYDGKKAIGDIALLSSDLEENGIESVEEVELVFNIINPKDYSDTRVSDPITFSVK